MTMQQNIHAAILKPLVYYLWRAALEVRQISVPQRNLEWQFRRLCESAVP
jgi:hypothetical protein